MKYDNESVTDKRGNITTLGGIGFTYDMADQPITLSGGSSGTYAYDGNLKRVKSTVNGVTRYNVYDVAGMLVYVEELDDLNISGDQSSETEYLHGAGMTLARIRTDATNNGVFTYLHPDHLGSPQAGTTETGTIAFKEQYTPFGEALLSPAANDNQSGFTGHIKDSDTGLNYMQARYYDPNIGRFLSVDPVGFLDTGNPGMFNRYAYTFNDPINLIDPEGLVPGDRFDTPEEAAEDVIKFINSRSVAENLEYSGTIERDVTYTTSEDGESEVESIQYFATEPVQGEVARTPIKINPATTVGEYHTHGDYSVRYADGRTERIPMVLNQKERKKLDNLNSDKFSHGDQFYAYQGKRFTSYNRKVYGEKYKSHLGTPSGQKKTFTPRLLNMPW